MRHHISSFCAFNPCNAYQLCHIGHWRRRHSQGCGHHAHLGLNWYRQEKLFHHHHRFLPEKGTFWDCTVITLWRWQTHCWTRINDFPRPLKCYNSWEVRYVYGILSRNCPIVEKMYISIVRNEGRIRLSYQMKAEGGLHFEYCPPCLPHYSWQ